MPVPRRRARRVPNPKALPYRAARQVTQVVVLLIFVTSLLLTRGGALTAPIAPALFFQLDPLVFLTTALATRQWMPALALGLLTLAMTLALGRVWCGWLCPLGATLDLVGPPRRPDHPHRGARHVGQGVRPSVARPQSSLRPGWRRVKVILLAVIVGASLAGNLSLLLLDPLSLLTRGLSAFLFPALNSATLFLERALYTVEPLQPLLERLDGLRVALFPTDVWWGWNILPGLLLLGVIGLNWITTRFWCRYLCPLGGLLGLVSRVAVIRRVVGHDACRGCELCARACPMDAIDQDGDFDSDPAECTVCLDCLPDCPKPGGQTFAPVWSLAPAQPYDPTRRQLLVFGGVALLGAGALAILPDGMKRSERLIRPPGAADPAFLATCVRCSACVKVCPTSGLQPAVWEAGLEGVWTPLLIPRLGYCDYSCHACGQACPTGAIPNLSLEVKRGIVIGRAEIDRTRCLPWSANTPCIVCEEMCPRAPKAIELETVEVNDATQTTATLHRPHVVADQCIGCGICEFKCPVEGVAAIRVRVI